MKKTLLFLLLFSLTVMAQTTVRSYTDQVQIGDSINTHFFASSYNYLRITVYSSAATDTLYVRAGNVDTMAARVSLRNVLENTVDPVITGVAATESNPQSYRQFWIYVPGGMRYVIIRRSDAVTTVKYRIESVN